MTLERPSGHFESGEFLAGTSSSFLDEQWLTKDCIVFYSKLARMEWVALAGVWDGRIIVGQVVG